MIGFSFLWLGQLISAIGSALPAFAFEINVFQNTSSVTSYVLIYIFLLIPGIIFAPVSGIIVDSFNKKNILIITNLCLAINSLAIYLIYLTGHITPISVYIFSTITSLFNTVQYMALFSALNVMIRQHSFTKGNYLITLLNSIPRLFGPAIAGFFLVKLGMNDLLLFNIFSFFLIILFILPIPIPIIQPMNVEKKPFLENIFYGFNFVKKNDTLLVLLWFSILSRFAISVQGTYVFLIILILSNPAELGMTFILVGAFQLAGVWIVSFIQKKNHALAKFDFYSKFSTKFSTNCGIYQNECLVPGDSLWHVSFSGCFEPLMQ